MTGEWVLVSPQRTERPWLGHREATAGDQGMTYDPDCYLCPGNLRAGGIRNPVYTGTFAFDNDYPALVPDGDEVTRDANRHRLLRAIPEPGICQVLCFSPRHDLTMARMTNQQITGVIHAWSKQTASLAALPWTTYVQIFENKGELMGCSNPHPHCQIWASGSLPNAPAKEDECQKAHAGVEGECLLCAYTKLEMNDGIRLVCANDHFAALVPYWAVWPFEVLVTARRHMASFTAFEPPEIEALADLLGRLTR
ncbi:galactose-1-phosphate uridylyltransferase, partial [bacterium]|nr:galactose-1-phosphate uridylyltransferase [candidate division CSSED10-310 bacterium]